MNPQDNRPAWYGAPTPTRRRRPVKAPLAAALVLLALLAALAVSVIKLGGGDSFRRHNFAGNAASERGDFGTANYEYTQMIALRPNDYSGYFLRAICESQAGQPAAAVRDNTAALNLADDPIAQDPEVRGDMFYNRGEAYAAEGRYTNAVQDFTEALALYPQEGSTRRAKDTPDRLADTLRQRAEAYWQHKEYARAVGDSSALVQMGRARPDDYGIRGKAEGALGLNTTADADLTRAIQGDPADVDFYTALSDLDLKRRQPTAAVAVFQSGVSANPHSELFWGNLGWYQYEAGQIPAAIQSDQHARSLDPKPAWVTYNLALIYAVQGQAALAQTAYREALRRSTPPERAGALTDIRHALEAQPGSAALHQALALVTTGAAGSGQSADAPLPTLPLPASPTPTAPPGFAGQLGPEVSVNGYGIRPPRGYTLSRQPQVTLTSRGTEYLWLGPTRSDGTAPTLEVVVSTDDGYLAAHSSSQSNAEAAADLMGKNHLGLAVTPVSAHPINSLPFAAAGWQGVGVHTFKRYKGSEYWLVSPYTIVHLATHDAAAYDSQTGPLLRASVSTFHKR